MVEFSDHVLQGVVAAVPGGIPAHEVRPEIPPELPPFFLQPDEFPAGPGDLIHIRYIIPSKGKDLLIREHVRSFAGLGELFHTSQGIICGIIPITDKEAGPAGRL